MFSWTTELFKMLSFYLLASCSEGKQKCGIKVSSKGENKIIGGTPLGLSEFPWLVHMFVELELGNNTVKSGCTGTIITERIVLTAAHCVDPLQGEEGRILGIAVLTGQQTRDNAHQWPVIDFLVHENYMWKTKQNDLGLLVTKDPFTTREGVFYPICLATRSPRVGEQVTTAGFGVKDVNADFNDDGKASAVDLEVLDNNVCREMYKKFGRPVQEEAFCVLTEGKSSCYGDSGGPALYQEKAVYYQVGLVSWGVGCARMDAPGVYMDIYKYLPWINNSIKTLEQRQNIAPDGSHGNNKSKSWLNMLSLFFLCLVISYPFPMLI